jgi:hypothetical protein
MERNDYFTSVTSNNAGEYFVGGSRHYYFDQTGYLEDFWIYNISDDGNILFADTSMTGGSHEVEIAHDIIVDGNDNIFYGGETKSFGYATIDNHKDAFIGKLLNTYYQVGYINNFGVQGNDKITALDYTYDKGIIAIGNLNFSSTGGGNMIIVKIDQNNTGGIITVLSEVTNENITLNLEKEVNSNDDFNIYPLPVQNILNITGLPQTNLVTILSSSGQVMLLKTNAFSQIDTENLSKGIYILKIETDSGIYLNKIIKI